MSQPTGEFRIELELLESGDAGVEVVRYWYWLAGTVVGARSNGSDAIGTKLIELP